MYYIYIYLYIYFTCLSMKTMPYYFILISSPSVKFSVRFFPRCLKFKGLSDERRVSSTKKEDGSVAHFL